MIFLAIPRTDGNERKYLNECIDTNFVSSVGPFVSRFEEDIRDVSGAQSAVAVCTGTAAIHLSLLAAGVKPNDLVILPSFTFIASANAIAYCQADPWLMDITEESWTLDPEMLREALKKDTKREGDDLIRTPTGRRIACIMPVYTLGCPADMDPINEIAKEYNLPIVADGAAAIGATYKGRPLAELADLTTYSFNGNKTITAGGGGAIVGNNVDTLKHIKHLSTTARPTLEYLHDHVGYNYRLTNIAAAVGCAQIERLDEFIQKKRQIKARYDEAFADTEQIKPMPVPEWAQSACWFSGGELQGLSHDEVKALIAGLNERKIQARPFWMPIHLQPSYQKSPVYNVERSDKVWKNVLTLPCSTLLTDEEQTFVIESVKELLPSSK